MVTHVVEDNTTGYVDSRVIFQLRQNLGEALQSLLEVVDAVVHQTQMEPGADEVLLQSQRLQVTFDSFLVQILGMHLVVFV